MRPASAFSIPLPFLVEAGSQWSPHEGVSLFKRMQVDHAEQGASFVTPRRRNQHSAILANVEVGYPEAKAVDAVGRSNNLQPPCAVRQICGSVP